MKVCNFKVEKNLIPFGRSCALQFYVKGCFKKNKIKRLETFLWNVTIRINSFCYNVYVRDVHTDYPEIASKNILIVSQTFLYSSCKI